MFRHLFAIPLTAGAALLASCAGTVPSPNSVAPIVQPVVSILPANIAALVKQGCGWEPLVSSLVTLINANPLVSSAQAFADMVCTQVLAVRQSGKLGGDPTAVLVNGVVIQRRANFGGRRHR